MSNLDIDFLASIVNSLSSEIVFLKKNNDELITQNNNIKKELEKYTQQINNKTELQIKTIKLNQGGLNLIFNNGKYAVLFNGSNHLKYQNSELNKKSQFMVDLFNGNTQLLNNFKNKQIKTYVVNDNNIISNIKPFTVQKFEKLLKSYHITNKCIKNNIQLLNNYIQN